MLCIFGAPAFPAAVTSRLCQFWIHVRVGCHACGTQRDWPNYPYRAFTELGLKLIFHPRRKESLTCP